MLDTSCQQRQDEELELVSLPTPSMSPDRGSSPWSDLNDPSEPRGRKNESLASSTASEHESDADDEADTSLLQQVETQAFLAEQADLAQNFTVRGVIVGLVIGVLIAFSNAYFGLQTGWISGMV